MFWTLGADSAPKLKLELDPNDPKEPDLDPDNSAPGTDAGFDPEDLVPKREMTAVLPVDFVVESDSDLGLAPEIEGLLAESVKAVSQASIP